MVFVSAIRDKEKDLKYNGKLVCPECGYLTSVRVVMVYRNLSLFFIPTFSWKRRYFLELACCESIYSLDKNLGDEIRRGNPIDLKEKNLTKEDDRRFVTCKYCNHALSDGFNYCPNCGRRIL